MARGYAACLGAIALLVSILRNVLDGQTSPEAISQTLVLTVVFVAIGFVVGAIADGLIRQSVESNFRRAVAKMRSATEEPVAQKRV